MHSALFFILSTALTAAAVPAPRSVDGTAVPLLHRKTLEVRAADGTVDIAAYLSELNRALVKYGAQPLPAKYQSIINSGIQKRANEPLVDQTDSGEDVLYYGKGTVGQKVPQTFTFDFDTGSSDLFVPGPKCGTSQGCPGSTKYSQTGTDEKNTTMVTYGSGEVSGENYYDSVTIAGLTANHQNIVSLTQAQGFSTSASDSLLGMAFQSIANSKQPPFFQTLIAQGKVTTQEFSFYLGRVQSGTQGLSKLTLGGRDQSRFTGAVTQVPVTSQTYWQVAVDAVTLNGMSAGPTTKGAAAIDTGTTLILAPTVAASAIFAQIPGAFPIPLVSGSPTINLFAYPCRYSGTVAIQFAGKQFKINPLDFNFGQLTPDTVAQLGLGNNILGKVLRNTGLGGTCVAAIAGGDIDPADNLYVVGDSFLKNWYSIYSFNNYKGKPSVSFAAAAKNQ